MLTGSRLHGKFLDFVGKKFKTSRESGSRFPRRGNSRLHGTVIPAIMGQQLKASKDFPTG